jgi:hypothetical protein
MRKVGNTGGNKMYKSRYDFAIYGVDVQIHHPDQTSSILRTANGTIVEQEQDRDNWFFFAIPQR